MHLNPACSNLNFAVASWDTYSFIHKWAALWKWLFRKSLDREARAKKLISLGGILFVFSTVFFSAEKILTRFLSEMEVNLVDRMERARRMIPTVKGRRRKRRSKLVWIPRLSKRFVQLRKKKVPSNEDYCVYFDTLSSECPQSDLHSRSFNFPWEFSAKTWIHGFWN